jgi:homocitrate synthase NifV
MAAPDVPRPRISDATLRDSAHMPGLDFSPHDGVVIASLLRRVGIDAVEVGIVSANDDSDELLCRAVLGEVGPDRAMTLVMGRSREQVRRDLARAAALGFTSVMVSIPTSDAHARLKLGTGSHRRVVQLAVASITEAKSLGMTTTYSGEDAARADPAFLEEYVAAGAAAGADRFRLAETVAVLRPDDTAQLIGRLMRAAPTLEVELHSHNMLGLSVANAVAAAEVGVAWLSTTVGGLGERGDNTPLAEVLTCMWRFWDDDRYDLSWLTELSREVAHRSDTAFSATTGPTADLAYRYEIAGQWQHPADFEAVPAELVGNYRDVRVGNRLRPQLLRACLPDSLLADVDLDAAVTTILAEREASHRRSMSLEELRRAVAWIVENNRTQEFA